MGIYSEEQVFTLKKQLFTLKNPDLSFLSFFSTSEVIFIASFLWMQNKAANPAHLVGPRMPGWLDEAPLLPAPPSGVVDAWGRSLAPSVAP